MTKDKKTETEEPAARLTFEQSLAKLQQIVQQLEDGGVGLEEALSRYEEGIKYLKQCHGMLQVAERKIALLTGVDEQGNPVSVPVDEQAMSLEEKADQRSRRRSRQESPTRSATKPLPPSGDDATDVPGGLF